MFLASTNPRFHIEMKLWREIASLEKIQAEALKNEDYSKADTLTNEIQNKYASTKRNQQALSIIEQSLRELRQKQMNLFKSLVQAQKTLEGFYELKKVVSAISVILNRPLLMSSRFVRMKPGNGCNNMLLMSRV